MVLYFTPMPLIGGTIPSGALVYHSVHSGFSGPYSYTATLGTVVDNGDFLLIASSLGALTGTPTCTVGGKSAVNIKSQGNFILWQLAASDLAALGSSATVVISSSGSTGGNCIAVYRVSGANPTPVLAVGAAASGSVCTLSQNTAANQLIIAFCASTTPTAQTFTWVGITEDYDEGLAIDNAFQTGGTFLTAAAETPRVITCTLTLSGGPAGIVSIWQGH